MGTLISRFKLSALSLCLGLGIAVAAGHAVAQEPTPEFKQIELTEQQVTGFIAAQKDFAPLASRLMEAGETIDPGLQKDLDDVSKKHGFADFDQFEDVGANITIVLDGLDRTTGQYSDPVQKMKEELKEIEADASIPAEDKKLALDDLKEQIAVAQPLKFPANIELVKKHIKQIEELIPEEAGESTDENAN